VNPIARGPVGAFERVIVIDAVLLILKLLPKAKLIFVVPDELPMFT